jgi:hypothetical protein
MTTSGTATDQYLAGLFDGEGCVSVHLAKAGYITVLAKVTMCDRAPVEACYQRFGGAFQDGITKTYTGRHIYSWTVFNADAVEALEVFSNLCLVKNKVAKAALPIAQSMLNNPTRGVLTQVEKAARIEVAKFIALINKPVGAQRALDQKSVDAYMAPKRMGGGKKIKLSDGRVFDTISDAAKAIGVTVSAVSYAKKKGTKTAGFLVELV